MPARHRADFGVSFDRQAAVAVRILRESRPSVASFADELAAVLGWESLSRQAVYDWEAGRTRVPASVILAGAYLAQIPLEELLDRARRRCEPRPTPLASIGSK